nr:MAG TPA: hypothetical protein [Caudoviricetes sp.]
MSQQNLKIANKSFRNHFQSKEVNLYHQPPVPKCNY